MRKLKLSGITLCMLILSFFILLSTHSVNALDEGSIDAESLAAYPDGYFTNIQSFGATIKGAMPCVGNPKVLVFYVTFKNSPANELWEESASEVEDLFFGSKDSLRSFYYDSSYGKVDIDGTVYEYTTKNDGSSYEDVEQVIAEIVADKEDSIPWDEYDTNNDGYVDGIYVIARTQHSWGGPNFVIDYDREVKNTRIGKAAFLDSGDVGTIAHETCHMFGPPDMYEGVLLNMGGIHTNSIMNIVDADLPGITKFALGWIDDPHFVYSEGKTNITLKSYSTDSEIAIVFPNGDINLENWFIIEYVTKEKNNIDEGVRIWTANMFLDEKFNVKDTEVCHLSLSSPYDYLDTIHPSDVDTDYPGMFLQKGDSITPYTSPSTGFPVEFTDDGRNEWATKAAFSGVSITVNDIDADGAHLTIDINNDVELVPQKATVEYSPSETGEFITNNDRVLFAKITSPAQLAVNEPLTLTCNNKTVPVEYELSAFLTEMNLYVDKENAEAVSSAENIGWNIPEAVTSYYGGPLEFRGDNAGKPAIFAHNAMELVPFSEANVSADQFSMIDHDTFRTIDLGNNRTAQGDVKYGEDGAYSSLTIDDNGETHEFTQDWECGLTAFMWKDKLVIAALNNDLKLYTYDDNYKLISEETLLRDIHFRSQCELVMLDHGDGFTAMFRASDPGYPNRYIIDFNEQKAINSYYRIGSSGESFFDYIYWYRDGDCNYFAKEGDFENLIKAVKTSHEHSFTVTEDSKTITYSCPCGYCRKEYKEIHTPVFVEEELPTCTEDGHIAYWVCSDCGKYFSDEDCKNEITEAETIIEATGHIETVLPGMEATCTEPGLSEGEKCLICEEILVPQEEIPALGHDFGEWDHISDSTCTEHGYDTHSCSRCGFTETRELDLAEHQWEDDYTLDAEATCTTDGSQSIHCRNCSAVKDSIVIPATGHDFGEWVTVTDPTYEHAGLKERICSVCDTVEQVEIPPLERTSIAGAKISGIKNKVYTGKAQGQAPTVVVGNTTLKAGVDYKLTYANNKSVGSATVTLTGIGAYKGSIRKTFNINPQPTTWKGLTAASKGFTAKWAKKTTQTTGYVLQYSTTSNFKSYKNVWITKNSIVSKKVTKLKARKRYYVRIRTYKTVNGKKYYSSWSARKAVTTKR